MQLLCTPAVPDFTFMPRPTDWIASALDRAHVAARDVAGNYATPPWRFVVAQGETTQALSRLYAQHARGQQADQASGVRRPLSSEVGWVVVACERADHPDEAEHLLERSLTAVQRFALSLWSEDLHTRWAQPAVKDDPAVAHLLDIDPASESVIGVLWYAEDADALPPASDVQAV
ncbi:MAG: hypothetical protein AAF809_00360 [Bacteroidota bacterium]